MRIAYVTETYPPELNGVAATVAITVDHLRCHGWEVDLVRPRQPQEDRLDTPAELRTRGLPLPMYPDLRLGLARAEQLVQRWRRQRPAIVHVATEGPLGAAAIGAARRLGLPATADFRTNFHAYSRHYGLAWAEGLVLAYLRRFHNRADLSFVPTAALKAQLEREGFRRIEVVGRGVDHRRFSPARRSAALRAGWGVHGDEPVVLYVGRLAAEKNVRLVFDAFRQIAPRVHGARLVVVGDGPLRKVLHDEFPEALFTGPLHGAELAQAYASADVFLFPSLTDTFGNVLTEALASGLLVVAYDCAAAAAHVADGRSGLLAAPGDAAGFIARSIDAAERLQTLAPLRQAARATAEALGWDSIVRGFEGHLLRVLRSREITDAQTAAA